MLDKSTNETGNIKNGGNQMKLSGYEICESVIQDLRKKYSTGQLKAMANTKAKTKTAIAMKRLATRASKLKK